MSKPNVTFHWSSYDLVIENGWDYRHVFQPALTYDAKFMEDVETGDGRRTERRVKKRRQKMFSRIDRSPHIVTYQGFLQNMIRVCVLAGLTFEVKDERLKFPPPDLDAMGGFRFSQRELLTQLLLSNQSGMLEAPTRYGKTILMLNAYRAFHGLKTVVAAPGIDLVRQLHKAFDSTFGDQIDVRMVGGGRKKVSDDLTVCVFDSLHHCDMEGTKLLLVDEPHASVSTSRLPKLNEFTNARRYAFGATLEGRFDQADPLMIGTFGPILAKRTYLEAVDEGAICPIHVINIRVDGPTVLPREDRNTSYRKAVWLSRTFRATVLGLMEEVIPPQHQTLVFVGTEMQAKFIAHHDGRDYEIAMAKLFLNKKQREEFNQKVVDGMTRCFASNIYAAGLTFPEIRNIIIADGGGGSINSIQRPGRLAEIKPGKRCGVLFDFWVEPRKGIAPLHFEDDGTDPSWGMVQIDASNRRKAYEKKGYVIHDVASLAEAKTLYHQLVD